MTPDLQPATLERFIRQTLEEDIGLGDITSTITLSADARFAAKLSPRQPIVVAGLAIAAAFFRARDASVSIECLSKDGDVVEKDAPMMYISGLAREMLCAERSALNTLQHLCGIATMTREYVHAIEGTGCVLLDTRKTLPGLRAIEKYAARMGGAVNHRMRLDDGILIKDNHVAAAGSVAAAVSLAKAANTGLEIQAEVDTLAQIAPALEAGADRVLCDNMTPAMLREAVSLVAGRVPIEASGGVRLDTIRSIAETGVQFVSVGRITQSAPAADIALDYKSTD